ncbi:hypothetical protein TRVA0_025S01970 [Trichomonascus vanleenenianus]|uniref:Csm1p n=1 Tax=Trichomonascus vanleenenianus TaxID=2268995 RepID=UPI003ECA49DE
MPPRKKKSIAKEPEDTLVEGKAAVEGDVSINEPPARKTRASRKKKQDQTSNTDTSVVADNKENVEGDVSVSKNSAKRARNRAKAKKKKEGDDSVNSSAIIEDNNSSLVDTSILKEVTEDKSAEDPESKKKPLPKRSPAKQANAEKSKQPMTPDTPLINQRKRSASIMEESTPAAKKAKVEKPTATNIKTPQLVTASRIGALRTSVIPQTPRRGIKPAPFTFKMELPQDAKDIESKFAKLKDLRETKAEKLLKEYKQAAEKRFKAADELIGKLREQASAKITKQDAETEEEVEFLKSHIEELTSSLEDASDEIQVLKAKLEQQSYSNDSSQSSAVINLLTDLSGVVVNDIVTEKDGTVTFNCVQRGLNGSVRYKLNVSQESEDKARCFTFTPVIETEQDEYLYGLMPDYLSESLSFQGDAANQFYWKIIQALRRR